MDRNHIMNWVTISFYILFTIKYVMVFQRIFFKKKNYNVEKIDIFWVKIHVIQNQKNQFFSIWDKCINRRILSFN